MTKNVLIVGDGLASLAGVYNTVRQGKGQLEINVIGPKAGSAEWGKGPVYSSPGDLNVSTEKMGFTSLKEGEVHPWMTADGFLKWLNDDKNGYHSLLRGEKGGRLQEKAREFAEYGGKFKKGTLLPRRLEGLYLEILQEIVKEEAAKKDVKLNFIQEKAVDGDLMKGGGKAVGIEIILESGEKIQGDLLFDATGNILPKPLSEIVPVYDSPGGLSAKDLIIENPWTVLPEDAKTAGGTIMLFGTGLTAVDKFKELVQAGHLHRGGKVVMVSNHSFIPLPHASADETLSEADLKKFDEDLKALLSKDGIKATEFVRLVKDHITEKDLLGKEVPDENNLPKRKKGWQHIIDRVRASEKAIWGKMSEKERGVFNEAFVSWWNPLRNRISREDYDLLMKYKNSGRPEDRQLEVRSGTIAGIAANDNKTLSVDCAFNFYGTRPKALVPETKNEALNVRYVVNCSGPTRDISKSIFHKNLLDKGILEQYGSSEKKMGIRRAPDGFSAAGSEGFIVPLSIRLYEFGENLEGNGWNEGRGLNQDATEYGVKTLGIAERETELKSTKVEELRARFFQEIIAPFTAYQREREIIFRDFLLRDPKALEKMAERRPELGEAILKIANEGRERPYKIRELRRALKENPDIAFKLENSINKTPLAIISPDDQITESFNNLYDIYKSIRRDNRPNIDETAYKAFKESDRFRVKTLAVRLEQLSEDLIAQGYSLAHILKDQERIIANPNTVGGYGRHDVQDWSDELRKYGVYVKTFILKPGQGTPPHGHKEECLSLTLKGNGREVVSDDANPDQPLEIYDDGGGHKPYKDKEPGKVTIATPYDNAGLYNKNLHIVYNPPGAKENLELLHIYFGEEWREVPGKPGQYMLEIETNKMRPNVVPPESVGDIGFTELVMREQSAGNPLVLRSGDGLPTR